MKRIILFILFFNIPLFLISQNKKERSLFEFKYGENKNLRIEKIKKFHRTHPFNVRAIEFILEYYENNNIDSIPIFWNNLENKFPNKIEPFLLRVDFLYKEYRKINDSIKKIKQQELLMKAFQVNDTNFDVNYKLSKLFYTDFLSKFEFYVQEYRVMVDSRNDSYYTVYDTIRKKSFFIHPEDSALFYFHRLANINKLYKDIVYFPIRQIESYKKIKTDNVIDSLMGLERNCYFPLWYFVNLPKNWENLFSIDYLYSLEYSKNEIDFLELFFKSMNEPCLYNMRISENKEIYRFTLIRSFHNPISIRIEKIGNEIDLYWKKLKGSGVSCEKKLQVSKKKKITLNEWNQFIKLLDKSGYSKLPKLRERFMCDGDSWILENKTSLNYKIHKTNIPEENFKDVFMYLLGLTKMEI